MTGRAEPTPADLLERARTRERDQSTAERRAAGQFSTPVPIARALVEWALPDRAGIPSATDRSGHPRVLDPAVGGGVFALAAVERLRSLGDGPLDAGQDDEAPVVAVDEDPAAVAQAREGLSGVVDVVEQDFLALDPDDLGRFDAVVGNPPFVRQEGLDKDAARAHLSAFGPDDEAPYLDGERAIDGRSDAYVYFLTNATRFLRPGGRLGMVVPAKWLGTRYGETLQRFLLDHHDLRAVIGFDDRAFDEALVDVVLVCLKRTDNPAGPTRFARLTDDDPATVRRALADEGESGTVSPESGDQHLVLARSRLASRAPGKLSPLLDAPAGVADLLDENALVPLADLATPTYGHKTGANDVFFDPDVDRRFRAPAVTSFREVEGLVLADPPATVLDAHAFVEEVAAGETAVDPDGYDDLGAATLAALEASGYERSASYLRTRREYADRTTCAQRRVWFDLGPLDRPPILHPKFFDERVAVVHNRAGCVPSNAIDCLAVDDGVPLTPLLGALNSTLHALLLECWGRSEGGGALQLMTYELRRVPVVDVRRLGEAGRARLADGFRRLVAGEDGARERLDAAVLRAADVAATPAEVRRWREAMVRRRVDQ